MRRADSAPLSAPPALASTGAAERSALLKAMWFGIFQLLGLVSGWVGSYYFIGGALANIGALNLGPTSSPSQVAAVLGPLFRSLSSIIPIVGVFQIVGVVALLMAFRQLKRVDGRFSLPATLAMVLLLGALLAIAGAIPLFDALPNLISQIPVTPGSAIPPGLASTIASLIFYFILVAAGGLLAFVGLIGGQILGLWRIGSKYGETILELGAVFAIIPFLNMVAPVLVIVGANQARNRLSTAV